MNVEAILEPIREDLAHVEKILRGEGTDSRADLLSSVGKHVLSGGGKRFRPALTLLSGRLCGTEAEKRIPLAASVELIHNATLLHDDIVDEAAIRRGRPSAHRLWGDRAGVLAADFHFSRAFSLILKAGGIACLDAVNRTISAIVEGELLQFLRVGLADMDETGYRDIILRKTARLIATSCQLGALAGRGKGLAESLFRFGLELGIGFQMMDDLLDYTARDEILGKKVGTDFREAKYTLPLIVTLSRCEGSDRKRLQEVLEGEAVQRESCFPWARSLIERCGGFDYTREAACRHTQTAIEELASLPRGTERDSLEHLARFVVERTY